MNMCLKKLLPLILFFCLACGLYGKSTELSSEYFIRNNSSRTIYFTIELMTENIRPSHMDDVFFTKILNHPTDTTDPYLRIGNWEPGMNELQPESEVSIFRLSMWNTGLPRGILNNFKSVVRDFTVYDDGGNVIMTIEDLQEGTVTRTGFWVTGGNILIDDRVEVEEREGNITTESDWPHAKERQTIEITDDIFMAYQLQY